MSYIEKKGNIFNSSAMAVVNTINCVGAMGKGIALDFKLRFPDMFREYQHACFNHIIVPGQIWMYTKSNPIILNLAIKNDWKDPSRVEWIEQTLMEFVSLYNKQGITSVAFPWMGAMNGGISIDIIKRLTRQYLSSLTDINVEVYEFDPDEPCPLYRSLDRIAKNDMFSISELERLSDIKSRYWIKIIDLVTNDKTSSMDNLCHYMVENKRIIGKTNIERLYLFLTRFNQNLFVTEGKLF